MSIFLQAAAGGLIGSFLGYQSTLRGTAKAGLPAGAFALLLAVGCIGTALVLVATQLLLIWISRRFIIESAALVIAILLSGGVAKLWMDKRHRGGA